MAVIFINVGMLLIILAMVSMLGLAMWLVWVGISLLIRANRKGGRSTRS